MIFCFQSTLFNSFRRVHLHASTPMLVGDMPGVTKRKSAKKIIILFLWAVCICFFSFFLSIYLLVLILTSIIIMNIALTEWEGESESV